MKKVLATGSGTRAAVVLMIIGLAVVLLAVSLMARAGGGESVDQPQLTPAHGLPDRAHSSHAHPLGFDRSTRVVQPSRSHAFAPPPSGGHWQSRSGERHQESTANLALRINRLAKDFSLRGRRELATVVNQIPRDQRFYDATPKDLALLINSIGRLLDRQGDKRAPIRVLNTLAREVSRRDLGGRQWQPQNLALVVNGLSKGIGDDVTGALKDVTREVGHRDLSFWTSQGLALVICGIRKTEGEDITVCRNALAQEMARRDLHQWQSRHLAMAAYGLRQAKGEAITQALAALAQAVIDRQPELGQWTGQQLAMLVGGLSKGAGEQITRALHVLAKTVIHKKGELHHWADHHLAVLAFEFGKGAGAEITECLQVLAQEIVDRDLGLWTDQHLAMVSSGVGKGVGTEIAVCLNTLALEIAVRDLSQWTSSNLAMAADGIGKISQNPVFDRLVTECVNRAAQESP